MPLDGYGVLLGRPIDRRLGTGSSPHYQIHLIDAATDFRAAVNVLSAVAPSEVEFLVDEQFAHPIINGLRDLAPGWTALNSTPAGGGLDYIRGNLFDRTQMVPLPISLPGADNDLDDKLDRFVQRAMGDEAALIYAFGQRWGPEPAKKDQYFGFLPGNGVHDIHMNQGNAGSFAKDDGVWQDGGLVFHYPTQDQWVAIFLRFQSQSWHTEDATGHQISGAPEPSPVSPEAPVPLPTANDPNGLIRIVAALVNSVESPEIETVTLLNASPTAVDLNGWSLADKNKNLQPLSGQIDPGECKRVRIAPPMQLSNKGGIITVLDDNGLKVDGVSYTKAQAQNPGWTLSF